MTANNPTRRACLVMPGYGQITVGAARGLYESTTGKVTVGGESLPLDVRRAFIGGPLLAHVFNTLWAWARNKHRKHPIDYFAMLHSDVEPQGPWLDTLIEEMEARELDVLGTVVPIKGPEGLTSIALDRPDGSPWHPQCRLTMQEVYRLPETFTSDDVGYRLLLNTGCWVCRFGEWSYKTHFTINDHIVFDPVKGYEVAEVEPEDWYFSRRCHELGLRIGATRKVAVQHVGPARFTNQQPWGDEAFDSEFTSESVIPIHTEKAAAAPPAAVLQEV